MSKMSKVLLAILAVLVAMCLFFMLGTKMREDHAVAREGENLRCDVTLSNGSVLACEYIEVVIVSPEDADFAYCEGIGENVGALSQKRLSFAVPADGAPYEIEIGYYVLGSRRTISFDVR